MLKVWTINIEFTCNFHKILLDFCLGDYPMELTKTPSVIRLFKQYSNADDPLKLIYGISSSEHFDCVFIAPTWCISKVFIIKIIICIK